MLRIAIVTGNTRPGRSNCAVAHWVYGLAEERRDANVELVDIADFNLPLLDEPILPSLGQYTHEHTKKWSKKIESFDAFVFVTPEYNHSTSGALKNATVPQLLPLLHGAICVGIAGALDELVAFANTGRQQLRADKPMWGAELFQGELGGLAADLRAARAYLLVQAITHWRHACAGTLSHEALLIQSGQTAIWLGATCARIADVIFALAGSSGLEEASPLQRRLLDLHAAAQHAIAQQRNYVSAGKLLLDSFLDLRTGSKDKIEHLLPAENRRRQALLTSMPQETRAT